MTLMFYLGADWRTNPLSLINDVIELTKNNVDISNRRVVILYDGAGEGDSQLFVLDSPFGNTYRKVELKDAKIETISINELNMGSKETLKSYINFVKDKIPSSSYSLYFGAHGTGFTSEYSSGLAVETHVNNEEDLLLVSEISDALNETGAIDLLVFDACNMGTLENIYELRSNSSYLIGSPVRISGPGNNYTPLIESLYSDSINSVEDLAKDTLESYYDYYAKDNSRTEHSVIYNKDLLQLYDVKKITEVIESDNFLSGLKTHIDNNKSSAYTFASSNYIRVELPEIDQYITTAVKGEYKLISVYYPSTYKNDYSNTDFAVEFPEWVSYLNK